MRSEVPNNVDISLKKPKVYADGIEIEDVAKFARVDQLPHLANSARINERVVHHKSPANPLRSFDQIQSMLTGIGKGLFNQDVLAGFEGRLRDAVMRGNWGSDHYRVDIRVAEQFLIVLGAFHARISLGNLI